MASMAQAKAFIKEIAPLIKAEAKARGYKVCSPVIAQACIESNYGLSKLSANYHNYFGMKCGSSWKGRSVNMATKEEYNSQLVSIRDNFRAFDNMTEGVKGYFDFISTKRYANLKDASTPREYLELIKKDGYATSSSYVNTNMNVVTKFDLTQFDDNIVGVSNPYKEPQALLRKGMKGNDVKWLQYELNKHGSNLAVDGDFGEKTRTAVMTYQKANGLVSDGIVGAKTLAKLKSMI